MKALAGDSLKECGNGWYQCICPAHDDHDPSLYFRQGTSKSGGGKVSFKCQSAGCKQDKIANGWNVEEQIFYDNYGERDDENAPAVTVKKEPYYYSSFEAALDRAKKNAESAFKKNGTTTAICDPQVPYKLHDGTVFGYNVRFEPVEGKKYFQPIRRVTDNKWFIGGGETVAALVPAELRRLVTQCLFVKAKRQLLQDVMQD